MKKTLLIAIMASSILYATPPQNVEVKVVGNEVELSWDAQEPGDTYWIYYSTNADDLLPDNLQADSPRYSGNRQ